MWWTENNAIEPIRNQQTWLALVARRLCDKVKCHVLYFYSTSSDRNMAGLFLLFTLKCWGWCVCALLLFPLVFFLLPFVGEYFYPFIRYIYEKGRGDVTSFPFRTCFSSTFALVYKMGAHIIAYHPYMVVLFGACIMLWIHVCVCHSALMGRTVVLV